jgi:hypothetical protein
MVVYFLWTLFLLGLSLWNTWFWFWIAYGAEPERAVFHLLVSYGLAVANYFWLKTNPKKEAK